MKFSIRDKGRKIVALYFLSHDWLRNPKEIMIYKKDNIAFDQISPSEFERLCYELLLKYGFTELTWRQGGADNGRDIEGFQFFNNQLQQQKTRWFFECKRYTGGVNVDDLSSKIAWADAEKPDYLVFLVTSYLTTPTKTWLEKITKDKFYRIIILEGEDIKNRLVEFPDLIEGFFSVDRYKKLFADVKDHWFGYSVEPSYEILKLLAEHIEPANLTINEIGFLFIGMYKQYHYFETRNDYYGDFDTQIFKPFYPRLEALASLEKMILFQQFKDDFSHLGGSGIIDELDYLDEGEIPDIKEHYQYYTLHLNPGASREHWAIGHYLFFRLDNGMAFELFALENSDFTTAIQFHPTFEMYELEKLTLEMSASAAKAVSNYFRKLE